MHLEDPVVFKESAHCHTSKITRATWSVDSFLPTSSTYGRITFLMNSKRKKDKYKKSKLGIWEYYRNKILEGETRAGRNNL